MSDRHIEFCGAFNGRAPLRPGESLAEAGERLEKTLQRVLDRHAKRLGVVVGVDFGELKKEQKQ